jgi:hypothetical protein
MKRVSREWGVGSGVVAAVAFGSLQLSAQTVQFSAHAMPTIIHVDPIPGGGKLTEARIVHPFVAVDAGALGGRVAFRASLNLEGITMRNGELSPGSWGEGYMDRRHPHTYVHELMLSGLDVLGGLDGPAELSVSAGKGFVPFGSDDPMSRPVLRYPVNHHIAQVLERLMVAVGARAGPVEVEGALFNGDEPEKPAQWPRASRLGDSWSLRLTARPATGVEWQVSRAKAASPEHRGGAGLTSWKWSTSARLARPLGRFPAYALLEWARTEEGPFVFSTRLLEAAGSSGPHRVYYRFERTDRPEEERTIDPFRSIRPHNDNQLLGITRWTVHTIGYDHGLTRGSRREVRPFLEVTRASPRTLTGVFDPATFYGGTVMWSVAAGVRLSWGMVDHRMGRYRDRMPGASMDGHSH